MVGGRKTINTQYLPEMFLCNYFRGRIRYSHLTGVGRLGCSDVASFSFFLGCLAFFSFPLKKCFQET